eukprot:COSAG02_NODE_21173_length_799_cov_1.030000_2_plen_88_part_00
MIATQAAELGLYAWYEHWAKDTFKLGFRKNDLIAIGAMVGAQITRIHVLQGWSWLRAFELLRPTLATASSLATGASLAPALDNRWAT